jgi:Xaa-Pro aminopeptidase
MFDSTVYSNRRKALLDKMTASRGLAVFVGNVDAAMNYRGNDYKFRQDSNFMYF